MGKPKGPQSPLHRARYALSHAKGQLEVRKERYALDLKAREERIARLAETVKELEKENDK